MGTLYKSTGIFMPTGNVEYVSKEDDMAPYITDSLEYRKHLQRVSTVMNQHVQDRRHYNFHGECIKCPECGSEGPFKEIAMDNMDLHNGSGPVTESRFDCYKCGNNVAFWAYGSYDPEYSWFHPENSNQLEE